MNLHIATAITKELAQTKQTKSEFYCKTKITSKMMPARGGTMPVLDMNDIWRICHLYSKETGFTSSENSGKNEPNSVD